MSCLAVIVDDDPGFLRLAARILTDLGVEVVGTAGDAAQAVEVIQHSRPNAVLVDVGLPDRDGIDLAYQLSALPWAPKVVVTSSDSEAFVAIEARGEKLRLPFIAKEELAGETLRRAFTDGWQSKKSNE